MTSAQLATVPFLYRKEIAELLRISTYTIIKNERTLGLAAARRDINARVVLYDTQIALQQLSLRGKLPSTFYAVRAGA